MGVVLFRTKARSLAFAIISSLSVLACSSSTEGGPSGSGGSTPQSTSASDATAASANGGNGPAGTSAVGGSGGGTSAVIVSGSGGGAGGFVSNAGGTSSATSQAATTGGTEGSSSGAVPSGGTTGRTDSLDSGGAGPASAGTSGGAGSTGGRSSLLSGGTGGGPTSSGGTASGGHASAGGTTNTGGASSTGGTTAPSDSLCPPGITRTITVAKDGSGQFNTVQAAVNSITSGSKDPIRINIKAGTYSEKLTIAGRTNLCLVGASATTTILSYGDSNASTGGTSTSASVHISADDFSAANLTFQNTYGAGSQAVALRTTGDRQQFLNCRFVGYQDTLYTHNGSQYFRNCYVQGNTDYVFGGATAVLQNCEVRNVQNGSAVAAPNTDAARAYGIVFMGGKFTAASGVNSVALGRPWGADGFAAYLNVELGSHISAAGFVVMSGNQPQKARFHEYGSTGSGANASARSSYQLTAAQAANYTLTKIFGNWTPTYSQ